jgi:hypothetical protein
VAKWQDVQFRTYLENFPIDTMILVIDFFENYSFEIQNEVQNMHLHSYQVTILVHICWMQNPNPNPHDPNFKR